RAALGGRIHAATEAFETRSQRKVEELGAPLKAAGRAKLRCVGDQTRDRLAEVRVVATPVQLRVVGMTPLDRERREARDRSALQQVQVALRQRALDDDVVPVHPL